MVANSTEAAEALSGNFGAYVRTAAYIMRGNVRFEHNGTTLDLVLRALESGARLGDEITSAGIGKNLMSWELVASGGGDRTPNGVWAKRIS